MAAPDEKNGLTSAQKQQADSNPVIENKKGKTGKGTMKKLWIIIAILVVLTAVGLTLGLSHFKGVHLAVTDPESAGGLEAEQTASGKPKPVTATLALDSFLVNLADEDSARFVKASFRLGLAEEPDEKKIEVTVPAIRDSIITLLSSKTAEQIRTPQGKDKLREQIRTRVNSILTEVEVVEVYIVDFVVQL
ncbi:MAG: flagellar basal body-associated FliL family protein [Acidobacteria bacterium]|nr:flagellar basal body-associated FliL family protein [Acidobacteriota bacterium]